MITDKDEACFQLEQENLNPWETEFISSIQYRTRPLTERQAEVLAKMCKEYLNEDIYPIYFQ